MADRLHQVLRWGLGSVEIFFSRHNPIWYGYRKGNRGLKGAQRLAYINTTVYPFTSIPLVVYCMLPALCLFFNQFVTPQISSTALIYFFVFFASIAATAIMEMRWSNVTFTDYWRNEQVRKEHCSDGLQRGGDFVSRRDCFSSVSFHVRLQSPLHEPA